MAKSLDPTRCCKQVRDHEFRWPRYHQCLNKWIVTVDGKHYCRIHNPEAEAKRKEESDHKWTENWKRERYKIHGPMFYHALKQIAEGHNDPRQLAEDIIKKFHEGESK